MTGILPHCPALLILPRTFAAHEWRSLEHARAAQILFISELHESLNENHKDFACSVSIRREKSIAVHNKATNIIHPSFVVGDFVLVRRANDQRHKQRFRWFRQYRITAVYSPLVYGLSSLRSGKTERFHCARLIKHCDSLLGSPVPK